MKKSQLQLILILIATLVACKKDEGELRENQAPDTSFSIEAFNLSGDNRLNSIVTISWFGKDPDGFISGYELSKDGINWEFTTQQDSTFQFSLDAGADTSDIELYVRAIDNLDLRDPSPDFIRVPIKNTPPEISINEDLNFPDTAFLVATAEWNATDIDGVETITNIQASLNGKSWFDLSRTKSVFSITPLDPTATDTVRAQVYYDNDANPAPELIEGLAMNDTNVLYLRAIDQAGTVSKVDTSTTFFMKGKTNEVVLIGGIESVNANYLDLLDSANVSYDFVDYGRNNGELQPKLWNTTFRLILTHYNKLILYSDETQFTNDYTGVKSLILDFAAASIQEFANKGGKYIIASAFDHNTDISAFTGILPIRAVSNQNYADARFYKKSSFGFPSVDSLAISPVIKTINGSDTIYFDSLSISPLNPNAIAIEGVGVYYIDESDSEVLYEAQLSFQRPNRPWTDTKIIASGRRFNGKLNQIYFSMQLFELNGKSNMPGLLDFLINTEFN